MKRISFLSLVGLLIAAPWPVALCAEAEHNFARWEKDIAAYEQADRTNAPAKGGLLFIGSSTIVRWKTLARDFPEHRVVNRGFGGSEIVDATHFAERLIFPYQPRMVFLRSGGNDLNAGKPAEQVFADFKEFVAKVHSKLPETQIVFISLSSSIARWKQADKAKAVNKMVQGFASQTPRVKYIETYPMVLGADGQPRAELFVADKLHFSDEGYKLLIERVRSFLPK